MQAIGLSALLSPKQEAELNSAFQSDEPCVLSGLKTFECFTSLPFLESLDSLLNLWPGSVSAHLPKIADEASSIDVSTRDARKLFENGIALMFDNAHEFSPELTSWLASIREELGLSALTQSRCLLYATPEDKGTAPHFDQNVNLVLQIHGKKKWSIAPNQNVVNPLSRHTLGLPVDPEMQTYAQLPMPLSMPKGARAIVLEPGSLLFVPRGSWHSTEAASDALSLNFTYTAPSWLDLLSAALRSRLALSPEWRAIAHGVSHPDLAHRKAASEEFESLLSELRNDLPNWSAAEILEVTEGNFFSG